MLFKGQRALVVGASGGIGRAIAEDLIAGGCDVAPTFYRHGEASAQLAAQAAERGCRCFAYALDVRDQRAVVETCERMAADLGAPPSLLVTSAGIVRDRPLAQLEPDDWRDVIET